MSLTGHGGDAARGNIVDMDIIMHFATVTDDYRAFAFTDARIGFGDKIRIDCTRMLPFPINRTEAERIEFQPEFLRIKAAKAFTKKACSRHRRPIPARATQR